MRYLALFFGLSAASLVVMVIVDAVLGAHAEFLNAYSVVQRVIGREPSVSESLVARQFGPFAEFGVVMAMNRALGGIRTGFVRRAVRPSAGRFSEKERP